jgi:hypothetical protein
MAKKKPGREVKKKKKRLSKTKRGVGTKVKPKKKKRKPKRYRPDKSKFREKIVKQEPEKPVVTSEGVADAGRRIRELFANLQGRLNLTAVAIVHEYEGEVDGELRVYGIRGVDTPDILQQIQEAMLPMDEAIAEQSVLGVGYWITVGMRWEGKGDGKNVKEEEDHYARYKGMKQLSSNYRPMIRKARIVSAFSAVLLPSSSNPNPMVRMVEKKFKKKMAEIFVRISWNPRDEQPIR